MFLLVLLLSCGGDGGTDPDPDPDPTPAAISIVSGDNQTGLVGQPLGQQVTARVVDDGNNPVSGTTVAFSAADGSVSPTSASTDANGRASTTWTLGSSPGAQEATASVGSLSATVSATAEVGEAAAVSVTPTAPATFTALGDTARLQATAEDEFGNPISSPAIDWSSADETVAAVDDGGLVTSAGNGSAWIVATVGSAADSVEVTVSQEAASFSVTATDTRLGWSETTQLVGEALDANDFAMPDATIDWSTGDASIASVDTEGVVTGEGLGSIEITGTVGAYSDGVTITVTVLPSASLSHTREGGCLLDESGTAYCWGVGGEYQLGDGSRDTASAPVMVAGGYQFVYLGTATEDHYCALTQTGQAYCWGRNDYGQLGDGTTNPGMTPVAVAGGISFRRITTGYRYTCGLTADGSAYCWGRNFAGQLGDGTTTDRSAPTPVSGGVVFDEIDAGYATVCGLSGTDGYCWGYNAYGETGDGTTTSPRTEPVAVAGGHALAGISSGDGHGCGYTTGGDAYCWGQNTSGNLGDGSLTNSASPVAVSGLSGVTSITAGNSASCAVAAGDGYCWGFNSLGALGDGTRTDRSTPTMVAGGLSWEVIRAGETVSCGSTDNGTAYCWGYTDYAGTGFSTAQTTPVPVSGGLTFQMISAGGKTTCATTASSVAYCWGVRKRGMEDTIARTVPEEITTQSLQQVSVGGWHACGLTDTGLAYCWGVGGGLGNGSNGESEVPVPVDSAFVYDQISAGFYHTCGIRSSDKALYCWGQGRSGQLGDGTETDRFSPTAVSGGLAFGQVAAGLLHTCGVTVGGAAYCWGNNAYGQLGDGSLVNRSTPTAVSGGLTFTGLTTGSNHTCGSSDTGQPYCWGSNGYGQLGDGTFNSSTAPKLVPGGYVFTSGDAGAEHICAIDSSGPTYCWGHNSDGQLGFETGAEWYSTTPGVIQGGLSLVTVTSGEDHTCGLTAGGEAYCWGNADQGQLGNGVWTHTLTPAMVAGSHLLPLP